MSLSKHLKDKFRIKPNKAPRTYEHVPDEVEDDDGVVMSSDIADVYRDNPFRVDTPLVTQQLRGRTFVTRSSYGYGQSHYPIEASRIAEHNERLCSRCLKEEHEHRMYKSQVAMNVDPMWDYGEPLRKQRYEITGVMGTTEIDDDPALD